MAFSLIFSDMVNPNLKDDVGFTPLHWAIVRGNRVAIRKLIVKGARH